MTGRVYLIGAGPGASDLITLRGVEALRRADVVVHDRLVNRELLHHTRQDVEIVYVGKTPGGPTTRQERIHEILIEKALGGATVVRLKGGDPYIFGRGWEELEACRQAGVACEVVPGVTSSIAAPASAGIPLTHRGLSRGFAVVAAQFAKKYELDYGALSKMDTVVILMGRGRIEEIAQGLIAAGRNPNTPAAVVACGTTEEQKVARGPLHRLAELADEQGLQTPSTIVVGEVTALAERLPVSWPLETLSGNFAQVQAVAP